MATAGTNITALAKPAVGTTTGPQWATDLNTSIDAVDGHDHSTNKGIRITPAAINVNADVEFNDNSATELKNLIFSTVTAATTSYSVYQASGNLYWRNGSGTAVQITTGSAVNAGAGSIDGMTGNDSGVTYADGSKTFNFFTDSGNGDYGKMAHADLLLFKYTNDNSTDTDYITIAANAAASGSSGTIYVPSENGTFLTTATSYAGAIAIATSSGNANIDLTPHGTGEVNISKVDIDAGTVDGATIGASSHTTGKFTTCDATTDFTIGGLVVTDGNIADTGTLAIVPVDGCTIALGSDAGDDFNIDGGKLVVEGDTGRCGIGIDAPATELHVHDGVTNAELTISGSGQGYSDASVALLALTDTNERATGVYMHDAGGDTEWYMGRRYSTSDNWMVARKTSVTSHSTTVAQAENALLTVLGTGDVGIGTPAPASTLNLHDTASGASFSGKNIRFSHDDGGAALDGECTGSIDWAGVEDGSGTQFVGAKIFSRNYGAWDADTHGAKLHFATVASDNSDEVPQIDMTIYNGTVGIGTVLPTASSQLHVEAPAAEIRVKGTDDSWSSTNAGIVLEAPSTRRAGILIEGNSHADEVFIGRPYAGENQLVFETNEFERMRIGSSGVVTVKGSQTESTLEIPSGGTNGMFSAISYDADNVGIFFDAHYDSGWKSKDAGSSFGIYKQGGDTLRFIYDTAAVDGAITWNDGIVLDSSGNTTMSGVLTASGGIVADLARFDTDALLLTESISSTGALSTGTLTLTSTQAPLNSIAIVMMHTNERSSGSGAAYLEMHQNTNDANKVGIGIQPDGWNHQYSTMHMPIVVSGDRVIAHSGTVDVAGGANNFDIYYVGYYMLATT